MHRTLSPVLFLAVLAGGCTARDINPFGCESEDLSDCYNLDMQIDGEEEENPVVSDDAQMCMAADGRLYVAWIDDRKGFRDVWFNSSIDGGRSWFPNPLQVKKGDGDASGLTMACAGDRVFVAWEDTRDGATDYENIYLNYSVDGGVNWLDQDKAIDNDPDGRSISLGPKIAIYQGSVHVVWFDQFEGAPDIYVSSSQNGGRQWRDPIRISGSEEEPGAFWSGNPRIAVGKGGILHVVWEDTRFRTQDIFHAKSNATWDTFGGQTRMTKGEDFGQTYGFAPALGVDGDNVYTVWHDTRAGEARDIFMNCSTDGGESFLNAAARVETDAPGSAESLNAGVTVDGADAHIIWQDNRLGGYDIFYRKAEGCEFPLVDGEPVEEIRLDAGDKPGFGNSINPQIVRRDGTMVVGWEDRRAGGDSGLNELYYNFSGFDAEENEQIDFIDDEDFRLDSIQAATKYTESLNIDVFGEEVYAAWVDNRDGDKDLDIYFSHSVLGEGVDTYEDILQAQANSNNGVVPTE